MTTVLFAGDPLTPGYLTKEATAQKYFPEWVVLGAAYSDTSLFGRGYDQQQWKHAFGVSSLYVPTPAAPRPVLGDPALADGRAAGGQDVQGPHPGAADLLHRAAPRRTRPHARDVPRRSLPLPVGADRGEPDPLLVGPSRHLADDRLLRRRRRHADLVEPAGHGHRRARQRRHRSLGVLRPRPPLLPRRLAAHRARRCSTRRPRSPSSRRSRRARARRATPRPRADRMRAAPMERSRSAWSPSTRTHADRSVS